MRHGGLLSDIPLPDFPFGLNSSRGDDLDDLMIPALYDCYQSSFSCGPEKIWSLQSFSNTALLSTTGVFWLCCHTYGYSSSSFKNLARPVASMSLVSINPPEMEILVLSTHLDWQKKGCANYMLEAIIAFSMQNKIENIYLEVRSSNKEARKLYANKKFVMLSRRVNYYKLKDGKPCDAHMLHRKVIS